MSKQTIAKADFVPTYTRADVARVRRAVQGAVSRHQALVAALKPLRRQLAEKAMRLAFNAEVLKGLTPKAKRSWSMTLSRAWAEVQGQKTDTNASKTATPRMAFRKLVKTNRERAEEKLAEVLETVAMMQAELKRAR
jgi:hypothetical protein